MNKRIVSGCKAVIINLERQTHYNGTIVTVRNYYGLLEGKPCWETDGVFINDIGQKVSFLFEETLQRIDDYDGDEKTSWGALTDDSGKVIYEPPLEIA